MRDYGLVVSPLGACHTNRERERARKVHRKKSEKSIEKKREKKNKRENTCKQGRCQMPGGRAQKVHEKDKS